MSIAWTRSSRATFKPPGSRWWTSRLASRRWSSSTRAACQYESCQRRQSCRRTLRSKASATSRLARPRFPPGSRPASSSSRSTCFCCCSSRRRCCTPSWRCGSPGPSYEDRRPRPPALVASLGGGDQSLAAPRHEAHQAKAGEQHGGGLGLGNRGGRRVPDAPAVGGAQPLHVKRDRWRSERERIALGAGEVRSPAHVLSGCQAGGCSVGVVAVTRATEAVREIEIHAPHLRRAVTPFDCGDTVQGTGNGRAR